MSFENGQEIISLATKLGMTTFSELINVARFNGCKTNADVITMLHRLQDKRERRQNMNAV